MTSPPTITLLFAGQVATNVVSCYLFYVLFSCAGVLEHPLDTPLPIMCYVGIEYRGGCMGKGATLRLAGS